MVSLNEIQTIIENAKKISTKAREIKSEEGNEDLEWDNAVKQAANKIINNEE